MKIHLFFDILAYLSSFYVAKIYIKRDLIPKDEDARYIYLTFLIVGFVSGSIIFSTINNYLSLGNLLLGKSILGAIFGGVVSVELYKYIYKIEGSTGAYFVPSLAIGIAIGRLGCFFAGLPDFTYGVETSLPWGVDFGDGIKRHAVQLYESLAMIIFFIYTIWEYKHNRARFEQNIFYKFILYYATQRFLWEFLKPYKDIVFGLDIFSFLSIFLIFYSIILLRRNNGKLLK